jgi:hypothetical protein
MVEAAFESCAFKTLMSCVLGMKSHQIVWKWNSKSHFNILTSGCVMYNFFYFNWRFWTWVCNRSVFCECNPCDSTRPRSQDTDGTRSLSWHEKYVLLTRKKLRNCWSHVRVCRMCYWVGEWLLRIHVKVQFWECAVPCSANAQLELSEFSIEGKMTGRTGRDPVP